MTLHPFAFSLRTTLACALLSAGGAAQAQTAFDSSRITDVTLYPGSATVERLARVPAGGTTMVFHCLPAGLDVHSLAVAADASVQVGELSVRTEERAAVPACAGHPLDGRIRALEDQKNQLSAENEALGLAASYLKSLANPDAAGSPRSTPDPKTVVAMADTLRRTGQDGLQRQYQIQRQQDALDRSLKPLLAERDRSQAGRARVVTVAVTVQALRDADVRLRYQVQGPGWSPMYRAVLDTRSGGLQLERQAQVAQATGEDWAGVRLRLSTGQPRQGTTGPLPAPWQIGIAPPEDNRPRPMALMAPAPAAAMARKSSMAEVAGVADMADAPLFEVGVLNTTFATEFSVPQPIDLPSNGQRATLALGSTALAAKLFTRTSPGRDASAWLVAELPAPEGVWPSGPLQLYRDGAFVGSDTLRPASPWSLSFGRDELVQVQVDPQKTLQASAGFTGSRAVRTQSRSYSIENRHRSPVELQVLEASPVSVHEDVAVKTQFDPQPASTAWNQRPGVIAWSRRLEPGATARFTASYEVAYPKDARLQER